MKSISSPPNQYVLLFNQQKQNLLLQRQRDVAADGHDGAASARAQRAPQREHDVLVAHRRRRLLLRKQRQDLRRAEQGLRRHDHVSQCTRVMNFLCHLFCWVSFDVYLFLPDAIFHLAMVNPIPGVSGYQFLSCVLQYHIISFR